MVWSHWLACVQIGDGDMLAVRPDGRFFLPLPGDDRLDGQRTTSLCQPDALEAFRVGVWDLDEIPLLALLLATDGYGNAQTADPWQPGVGRDLAKLAAAHHGHWFARQVPRWAQRCASADGSGDDATIALLLHPDAMTLAGRHAAAESRQVRPEPTGTREAPRASRSAMVAADRGAWLRRRHLAGWVVAASAAAVAGGIAAALILTSAPPRAHHPGAAATSGQAITGASYAPGAVAVTDPVTGEMVTVTLPPEVTRSGAVTAYVLDGSDVFVLAGNRVWRIPLAGGSQRPVVATHPLPGAANPLLAAADGTILVSGASGQVLYVIDPDTPDHVPREQRVGVRAREHPAELRGLTMVPLQAGQMLQMERAGATVIVGDRIGEGGQGVVHRARLNGAPFAVKWLRAGPVGDDLRKSITALVQRGGSPHPAFVWPIDLLVSREVPGFGYLMQLLDPRFISLAHLLNQRAQPSFRVLAGLGLELVDAFAALHSSGLCYRDISFGNLRADPLSGEVAIIDVDNIGIDGASAVVKGTGLFMAPEILRDEALPSTVTDLHSLAVLLFYLFMHGHPLLGSRADASYGWDGAHISETELLVRNLGVNPLFVFDPADRSNAPVSGDPALTWWDIYPEQFRRVFAHAFTRGLRDASLQGRVMEGIWRRALLRLNDCVSTCPSCRAAVFYDSEQPGRPAGAAVGSRPSPR